MFKRSLSLSLLSLLLASCSGGLSTLFAPDPQLVEQQTEAENPPSVTPSEQPAAELPDDFPQEIPLYPQARLVDVDSDSTGEQGQATWEAFESREEIATYYQDAFESNGWNLEPSTDEGTLVASQDGLEVTVLFSSAANADTTEYILEYQQAIAQPQPQPRVAAESPQDFADLEQAPEPLREYVDDLAALGVLTSAQNADTGQFNPNEILTRRDYARWLVAANNQLYTDNPGAQIRVASSSSEPAFSDVSASDPDFAVIQGLAEAGIIPSPLTNDSTAVRFRPDAPLTREELIAWKVPLDIRKAPPAASIEATRETWGFQDTADIDPRALSALYADYQNRAQSNVSRAFGYTSLFQPNKPVTRAEAAAVLWSFGQQGDVITAQEMGQTEAEDNQVSRE
ncbi:MAG: S-layer homology domain-containing protein [Cyanophyceae cyanobacterium]